MPSKPPQPLIKSSSACAARQRGDIIHHEVRIEGQLSGFWGAIAAILILLSLMAVFVLGLLTLTVGLWIACGVLLVGLVGVVGRALFGGRTHRPPQQ